MCDRKKENEHENEKKKEHQVTVICTTCYQIIQTMFRAINIIEMCSFMDLLFWNSNMDTIVTPYTDWRQWLIATILIWLSVILCASGRRICVVCSSFVTNFDCETESETHYLSQFLFECYRCHQFIRVLKRSSKYILFFVLHFTAVTSLFWTHSTHGIWSLQKLITSNWTSIT